jgi:hypothetical protein
VSSIIVPLLIVAALVLLASSWLSGRRDRDPVSSVHSFQRALSAMADSGATASDEARGHQGGRSAPEPVQGAPALGDATVHR